MADKTKLELVISSFLSAAVAYLKLVKFELRS